MNICRYPMASVSLKLLLLLFISLLLGATSAQELYDDQPILEQYSPMLEENFIGYPILEEYGVPSVEEFPDEGREGEDEDEESQETESTGTEDKDKKDVIKHTDSEHAQKTSSALNSKSDAREKRQLPLQDDPVKIAREKLQRAIKAAQALTGIEQELGLNPSTIENKTANLESELKSEEKTFKKMEDESPDATKKFKFSKLEKEADDDVNKAENILKLIVKLEAAKFLARQRAQDDLEEAEKRKLASTPPMILGQPVIYPPPGAGYYGGVQQPAYQTIIQPYTTSYQPQSFQGISSPTMASASNTMLSPPSLAGQTSVAPAFQPAPQDDTEIQRINAIKATKASASLLPPQQNSQQVAETMAPLSTKMANFASEEENNNLSPGGIAFHEMPKPHPPKQPEPIHPPITALEAQPGAHAQPSNDHKVPQDHAKPQQTKEEATAGITSTSQPAQPLIPVKPAVPAQPVMLAQPAVPVQPILPPGQTIEAAIGQSNGLVSQAAPLTASYNPSIVAPNLSPMSRYFDSPANNPSLFTPQSFSRPMPPQTQAFLAAEQPKKPILEGPEPAKPVVTPVSATVNDQPHTLSTPISAKFQSPIPAAYTDQQALPAAYPSNSFYSWNSQALAPGGRQNPWNVPALYQASAPAPAPYQAPVNPLFAEAFRKLHDSQRASLAMSKIEEAIGLSPSSVKHIIDDVESQAKQEEKMYEDDMSKEKADINKEKALIQNDELLSGENAKSKIKEDEAKIREDIRKENVAKSEVDKIKKIEKILTIIEAAKYSAMQRAKKNMYKLQRPDDGLDGDEIRKRDLEDLEKDMRRRRRNEINIWLKGSRNHIDTSRFLRNHLSRLEKHQEESSRWGSYNNKLFNHLQVQSEKRSGSAADDGAPRRESSLHRLKFFKTLVSNKKLDSGQQFAVAKRTDVEEKPKKSVDNFIMAKMLEKMDNLFKIQEDILKYLKTEHDIHRLQDKKPIKRSRRSLHHSKHHKKMHKNVKRNKGKVH